MKIKAAWGTPATIRFRLGLALAITLLPVLALGIAQSVLAFQKDAESREAALVLAAERSAATARARVESGAILLDTLQPQAVGLQCAQRLAEVKSRLPGYVNLIRFDRIGRVDCAAATVPDDPGRRDSAWFKKLASGSRLAVAETPAGTFGSEPLLLAASPSYGEDGKFDGAVAAVIKLESLKPVSLDRSLPFDTQVALIDSAGGYIDRSDERVFNQPPPNWAGRAPQGAFTYHARDAEQRRRVYAVAPLVGDDLYVAMSAPRQKVSTWAKLNIVSSVVPPILSFILALAAVWVVSELVVIRWLHYLQRIAAIYARGRFTVRPLLARRAPPEIRQLAETLDIMADAIVARDMTLHENLAQKDGLMREIHHRVKNNLQVISSLISMQQRSLGDPAARAAMQDTRQRISALALIYRALYQGPDLKRVDLRHFLEELIAQLIVADGSEHKVRTEISVDDLTVDPDKLAPLALFTVEAITNAQKHAFKDRIGGVLKVNFRVEGETAFIEIADNGGSGAAELGEGVGRTLMMAFARQLGGKASFFVNPESGLTARLEFPTPGEPKGKAAKLGRNQAAA
jgi:two-component sensor histidine kinase